MGRRGGCIDQLIRPFHRCARSALAEKHQNLDELGAKHKAALLLIPKITCSEGPALTSTLINTASYLYGGGVDTQY
ncbi:hypothetical protein CesoFtcFv8_007830 [Champsocephalus esox]|uniref:Uncharacterized protein n=1 Tax=Champsocephalus esox TaxID=159716 RepID=A0AAN8CEX0_9TELE|nr:hypothetical protein CesoFtcFv8_007830 [Champsocephalus esox]